MQSSRAMIIPIHIEGAVTPVVDWIRKVSHKNAPGAINAMAFIVSPVKPSVGFISGAVCSAILLLLNLFAETSRFSGRLAVGRISRVQLMLGFLNLRPPGQARGSVFGEGGISWICV
jgi:hypothetical protein